MDEWYICGPTPSHIIRLLGDSKNKYVRISAQSRQYHTSITCVASHAGPKDRIFDRLMISGWLVINYNHFQTNTWKCFSHLH